MARRRRSFVGISGWTYGPWRGRFYPEGLPHRRELEYASRCFASVEINGSFYSLAMPDTWRRWREETPDDFVFAVKGSRFLTHMKKLKDPLAPLANFFAQGVLRLGTKLGPILWQFPEAFRYDPDRVAAFLDLLPKDADAAAELARHHDHRLEGRAWTEAVHSGPVRHAVEVRHESWMCADFVERLRANGVALVLADTAGKWPYAEDVTADFVYVRLHGSQELYASGYTDDELDWWAARLRSWTAGREPRTGIRIAGRSPAGGGRRDAFVYFDNDAKVHAPFDAQRLAERLGG